MADSNFVGNVVNNLPIDKMISAPLTATIKAQSEMSMALAQFVQSVGLDKDGNVRMVTFNYEDSNGGETTKRHIKAPFLALTGIPNLAVEEVNVSFELAITSAETEKIDNSAQLDASVSTKSWFSPLSVSMTGSVSHSRSQTRSTDTRAKYSFDICAKKQGTPEALQRIIDAITDSVATPQNGYATSNLIEGQNDAGGRNNTGGQNSADGKSGNKGDGNKKE
ncbi:MAG: DUF2589 domain-containing protein [Lachnoclostridium sp.]|nr:DUF2589 domain-containing protein [Lachnoclostridium sp.]